MNDLSLTMTRTFDAPVERVFDAWLDKSWGEWAGPPGIRGEVTRMEPRVGGRYEIVMHRPDGGTLTVGGVYRAIERPSKIVMSWKWTNEDNESLITLSFRSLGAKTELNLRHEGFAAAERRDSHNGGWTGTLDKLATHLAKHCQSGSKA
jgi:uncharacterized protein YndB with AHSA1/START domain